MCPFAARSSAPAGLSSILVGGGHRIVLPNNDFHHNRSVLVDSRAMCARARTLTPGFSELQIGWNADGSDPYSHRLFASKSWKQSAECIIPSSSLSAIWDSPSTTLGLVQAAGQILLAVRSLLVVDGYWFACAIFLDERKELTIMS